MAKGSALSTAALFLVLITNTALAENLLDVYWVAEKQEPTLRSAEANRQAARERHKQSIANLLPQADLTANASSTNLEYGPFSFDNSSVGYGLSLTQPIYHHDSYKQMSQTRSGIAQSDLQFEAAQRNLMIRVSQRYFTVLATQDNLEFVRAEKEAVSRQLEQTRQRFEVGLIAITDVHESQAAYDLTAASEIAAENAVAAARESLRELTGQYHDNLSRLSDNLPLTAPAPTDVKSWVELALSNNFTLKAARTQVEIARDEFRRQQAGHYPVLDLIGNYTYTDDGGISYNDESVTNSSLILQLSLPLSRGGATMARSGEARYKLDEATEFLEQTTRDIHRQTSDAYLGVLASISQVKALEQALVSTRSALSASEAGLEVGTRTTVDVLNTRRELYRAQRDHAKARYDYVIGMLRLKEAAGTLALSDFEEMVQWLN